MKNNLSYFNSRALFCGIGISYILKLSNKAFWLSIIIGYFLGLVILRLTLPLKDNECFKKITNFIIALVTAVILVNAATSLYLENTSTVILSVFTVISILLVSCISKKSLINLGNIIFPVSLFFFIIKVIGLYPYIKIENIMPILDANKVNIFLASIAYSLIGTVPILIIEDSKNIKEVYTIYTVSSLMTLTISFLIVSVLGMEEAILYRYPEYIVLKRIKILNFIYNVDNIFSFALLSDLFITSACSFKRLLSDSFLSKSINTSLLLVCTIFFCQKNYMILFLYNNLPSILLILLIMSIFPKKILHKISD